MKCMSYTMCGETAYTLKHISENENISISKLRNDIRKGLLKPQGLSMGAYYVVQSELNNYLRAIGKIK